MTTLESLLHRGFDRSWSDEDGYVRVRCSECEALVINRTPCHEQGCINSKRDEDGDDDQD